MLECVKQFLDFMFRYYGMIRGMLYAKTKREEK